MLATSFGLDANIWNNKIKIYLWQTEYIFYFSLILYFQHNGVSSTKITPKILIYVYEGQKKIVYQVP